MDTSLPIYNVPAITAPGASLSAALALWSSWSLDIPPSGSTGDAGVDRRLADAFRALTALPTRDERFTWIERNVFAGANDFPPPDRPRDVYRETMIQWWLELFETE